MPRPSKPLREQLGTNLPPELPDDLRAYSVESGVSRNRLVEGAICGCPAVSYPLPAEGRAGKLALAHCSGDIAYTDFDRLYTHSRQTLARQAGSAIASEAPSDG